MKKLIEISNCPVCQCSEHNIILKTNIDAKLVLLTDEMFEVMYKAPGIGLAATQIGVQRQIFVYDIDDKREVILNPQIAESSGEWV